MATCVNPTDTFGTANISSCEAHVFEMQMRLDNAVAEGNQKQIRDLYYQITRGSVAARILAVNRVTRINDGKRTAGVDGVKLPDVSREKQMVWRTQLLSGIDVMQKPQPIRRVYIPKRNGKKRPLGIPTIHDRIVQDIYRMALEPIVEYHFNTRSFGFRPKRSAEDAVQDILKKMRKRTWVVEGDIEGCFDNLSHPHILSTLEEWNVPTWAVKVIGRMLKAKVMHGYDAEDVESGTPQGGVISPLLANVALTALDDFCEQHSTWTAYKKLEKPMDNGQKHLRYKVNPITRYADDFVIVCQTKSEAVQWKAKVSEFLNREVGVNLSEKKTKITHINDGFIFLGFHFKKYPYIAGGRIQSPTGRKTDAILVRPPKERVVDFLANVQDTITGMATATQQNLIQKLNPLIRGWCNYYRKQVSKEIFADVEHEIWWKLWRWAKRRHPTKTKAWIHQRYFHWVDGYKHHFSNKELALFRPSKLKIVRHRKLKVGHRVYDRERIEYWKKREDDLTRDSLDARSLADQLWKRQVGKCPCCKTVITSEDITQVRTHVHHIKPRSYGGTWSKSNLLLIHNLCHQELHSRFTLGEMAKLAELQEPYYEFVETFV